MRKLVFAHGEKGGSGKSTIATVLVDLAPSMPLIVECDPSAPDVARRYQHAGYAGLDVPLINNDSPADVLSDLLSHLERVAEEIVVINMPSAAGVVVDEYAGIIADVANGLNRELVVAFAIGAGMDSAQAAISSAATGLVSVANRQIAVINAFYGRAATSAWTEAVAPQWRGLHVTLPSLASRVADQVRQIHAPLQEIAAGRAGRMPLVDRVLLQRWLADCGAIAEAVYG